MATATLPPPQRHVYYRPKRLNSEAPVVSAATVSATFIISTPTPDRSNDVVSPLGCSLTNYAKNPVVLYDHGFSGVKFPIGTSRGPNGKLEVAKSADSIAATCYFSKSWTEAQQVYALVDEGLLQAASVHLRPLECSPRIGGGLEITKSELLEWSIVGMPDNPEAVRKVLSRNRLAGKPIVDTLRKSLADSVENYLDQRADETLHQRLSRLEGAVCALCQAVGQDYMPEGFGTGDAATRLGFVNAVLRNLAEQFTVANVEPSGKALASMEQLLAEVAALVDELDVKKSARRFVDEAEMLHAQALPALNRFRVGLAKQQALLEQYAYSLSKGNR